MSHCINTMMLTRYENNENNSISRFISLMNKLSLGSKLSRRV